MKLILWDFDGTLATREGTWAGAIQEILQDSGVAALDAGIDEIRPLLRTGFPWHDPNRTHTQIRCAEQWWDWMTPQFERVFGDLGCSPSEALQCAMLVRPTYLHRASWRAFADVEALGKLTEAGWTHWIVSNHVPELRELVLDLGLGKHVTEVFTSALTGYEKPHPEAYRTALRVARGLETVWMVGDNLVADYEGSRKIGVPSILVRNKAEEATLYAENLWQAAELIDPQRATA
jgi:putative hydrolase of the HAD superfamily